MRSLNDPLAPNLLFEESEQKELLSPQVEQTFYSLLHMWLRKVKERKNSPEGRFRASENNEQEGRIRPN